MLNVEKYSRNTPKPYQIRETECEDVLFTNFKIKRNVLAKLDEIKRIQIVFLMF